MMLYAKIVIIIQFSYKIIFYTCIKIQLYFDPFYSHLSFCFTPWFLTYSLSFFFLLKYFNSTSLAAEFEINPYLSRVPLSKAIIL